jgi:hypothetical protein
MHLVRFRVYLVSSRCSTFGLCTIQPCPSRYYPYVLLIADLRIMRLVLYTGSLGLLPVRLISWHSAARLKSSIEIHPRAQNTAPHPLPSASRLLDAANITGGPFTASSRTNGTCTTAKSTRTIPPLLCVVVKDVRGSKSGRWCILQKRTVTAPTTPKKKRPKSYDASSG